MPLIVICGTPLSGKSYRSKQLYKYFTETEFVDLPNKPKCVLVTDEDILADLGPNKIFENSSQEKQMRAWLKSEAQRNLSCPETVVILDSGNYIKGYRYELYCLSKLFKTTHVVIECEPRTNLDESLLNDTDNKRSYSQTIYNELVQRYEKPISSNRWDSPLFKIAFDCEHLPLNDIKEAIFNREALKPNKSTLSLPTTTDNFLFELDSQTQQVIKQIQMAIQNNQFRSIRIKDTDIVANINKKIPISELNKLRRQFINYTRMHPLNEKERIVTSFVQFINKSV